MKVFPYNPMNYSYETLKAVFTAREGLLKKILTDIQAQAHSSSLQHYLVVGPRGIGKTHFLRLIYFAIKENKESWFPLQFAEEEYGVTNLSKFCLRIIKEIANELTDFGEKLMPADLEKVISELDEEEDSQLAVEQAISFLHRFVQDKKKKILLLVDNIDLILCSRFMDQLSLKRFRTFLMDEDTLLLIGASSTIFKEVIGYEQPLYNLFQRVNLTELPQEEAVFFIRNWAKTCGENKIVDNFDDYIQRVNSIYHLTGGNPRLLLFLFQIFTLGELPEVHSAFESLLDEITPYFKAKMESLSIQQREIMDALSKVDEAVSPATLATMLKLKINQVTAVIKTLVDNGYLKQIEKGKKKGTFYYDVIEQLFRIWYQIRSSTRQKKRFICLLEFINLWYSLDELRKEQKKLELKYTFFMEAGQMIEAEMVKMHLGYIHEAAEKKETEVTKWYNKGVDLYNLGRYDEAITCFDKALEIDPEDARAWNNKGVTLGSLGRHDEALTCFDKVLEIDRRDVTVLYNKGVFLHTLGRDNEAITYFDKALEIDPQFADAMYYKGIASYEFSREKETLPYWNKTLQIDPQHAPAWNNKGQILVSIGQYDEAITCFDNAIKYAIIKPEYLPLISDEVTKFYLARISRAIEEENIGTARQFLDKVIEIKGAVEGHKIKIPVTATRLNQLLMDFFVELLKKKETGVVLELLDILDKSKVSKYTGFLFPFKILAQYLKTGEEDIINRQRPEVKGIIKEVLSKISS